MRCWCRGAACSMRFGGWAAPAQPLPRGNVRDKAGQKSLCWCSWRTHGGCRRAAALPSDATVQQQQQRGCSLCSSAAAPAAQAGPPCSALTGLGTAAAAACVQRCSQSLRRTAPLHCSRKHPNEREDIITQLLLCR